MLTGEDTLSYQMHIIHISRKEKLMFLILLIYSRKLLVSAFGLLFGDIFVIVLFGVGFFVYLKFESLSYPKLAL